MRTETDTGVENMILVFLKLYVYLHKIIRV